MLFDLKTVFLNDGETKRLDYELDISDISMDGAFPFTSPVRITAQAQNRASLVTLTLICEYDYERSCDRCTASLFGTERVIFTHRLVQTLVDETNDDYIETPDFTLELDDVVTTDIILNYPQKLLCKEDCRGLCQRCGKNLNEGDCSCNKTAVDPRLEILKQLMEE